ncbi:MAG: DNA-processing protein DprA [Bacteroidaceae bacterium]|nr:DNA-processing protein DprA [Bacteroidaceae bacterium]
MDEEILYSIALTRVLPYQSQVQRQLTEAAGSVRALYEHRHQLRELLPSASERLQRTIAQWEQHMARAEQEMAFAEKNRIRVTIPSDVDYPARLRECPDAPIVLYYRGTADLNSRHMLSIVGTRRATEYGKTFCQRFLSDLSHLCPDVLIVSGLAYGIDIQAHRQALQNGLPTIGILAHGLDQIYPRLHRQTAIEMLQQGGLLTEFMSQSTAEKINFVARNRIVAGMTDATLVVESADKGGSLITAHIATDYNREVFAVPGRLGDAASAGCNGLIRDSQAILLQSAEQLVEHIGWVTAQREQQPVQRDLFPTLSDGTTASSPEEMAISRALKGSDGKQLNQLTVETNLPIGRLSSLLFDMEMRGLVRRLSGGTYRWI